MDGIFVRRLLFAAIALVINGKTYADLALIVHPSTAIKTISTIDAKALYLGYTNKTSSGEQVIPLEYPEAAKIREEFHKAVTGKNSGQLRAYWARKIFTGEGAPPEAVDDAAKMLKIISDSPGYTGYINKELVPTDGSVRVILEIPSPTSSITRFDQSTSFSCNDSKRRVNRNTSRNIA
jgi:hypothetical protein